MHTIIEITTNCDIHTIPQNRYIADCKKVLKCMVWPAVNTFWYCHTCWLLENVSYMNKSWKDLCLGTVQLVLCFVTPTREATPGAPTPGAPDT